MRDLSARRLVSFVATLVVLSIPAVIAVLTVASGGCGKMCDL